MKLTPLADNVLLKHMEAEEKTASGIILSTGGGCVTRPENYPLLHQNGTVTICHSRTKDLPEVTRQADILVSAVGKVGLVTAGMVKEGAVVIDVAMNRNSEGRLCGDVDFAAVEPKASYITPVPGGVGPMTRAMLMRNILTAARNHQAEK